MPPVPVRESMKAPGSTRDRSADLQTTLSAIASTAAQVCEAGDALIYLVDGDEHRLVAKYGRALRAGQRIGDTRPISRGTPLGRALLERRSVHVPDLDVAVRREFRELGELYRIVGARTSHDGVPTAAPRRRISQVGGDVLCTLRRR